MANRSVTRRLRKKTTPPAKRPHPCKGKRLGPADSLQGNAFSLWMQHLCATGPTWVYVAMAMQHLLCCRITEILRTKKEDIDIAGRRCFIKPMKGGGGLWKPLSEAAVLLLSRWETNDGLKVQRSSKPLRTDGIGLSKRETSCFRRSDGTPKSRHARRTAASRNTCHVLLVAAHRHVTCLSLCKVLLQIASPADRTR